MNYKINDIVKSFPDPVKRIAKHFLWSMPKSIRYGKTFLETYKFLQESQWWDRNKLEEYQLSQMERLLNHAYNSVPYYRRIFDERELKPRDIQDFKDLDQLPCLTKDDFKKNFKHLISKKVNLKQAKSISTSGTTGKPLQFYTNGPIEEKEHAFIFHQWSRVGYDVGDVRAALRGSIIDNNNCFELEAFSRVLRLSPRIDSAQTVRYYLKLMEKYKSNFLHGYPSTISNFAFMIKKYEIDVPFQLNGVLFASEVVYDWQKDIVNDVFNCRVFSHYGLTEKAVLAGECENSPYYHCLPQYGITEVDSDTKEIIGTGFLNDITPFIRYRTTDVASDVFNSCNCCEREYYPIFKGIEGRIGDFIITSKGLISPALITYSFKNLNNIKNTQIVQESENMILLRIMPLNERDINYQNELIWLMKELNRLFGEDMEIQVEEVEEIQTTKSGKFKWVISNISDEIIKSN